MEYPSVEYLKYVDDCFNDPEDEDVPHVEVDITTDLYDLPIRDMRDFVEEVP